MRVRVRKKIICDVCEKVIEHPSSRRQLRHPDCALETNNHNRLINEFRAALEKYEAVVRPKLKNEMTCWSRDMGMDELKKRFPDVYEREFPNS